MRRNLLLVFGIVVGILLVVNSTKRLLTFRTTSQKVAEAEERLNKLRGENQSLKDDLDYKKSVEFKEREIRDKLGMAREGETVVVLPKDSVEESNGPVNNKQEMQNWEKWWSRFFGS